MKGTHVNNKVVLDACMVRSLSSFSRTEDASHARVIHALYFLFGNFIHSYILNCNFIFETFYIFELLMPRPSEQD